VHISNVATGYTRQKYLKSRNCKFIQSKAIIVVANGTIHRVLLWLRICAVQNEHAASLTNQMLALEVHEYLNYMIRFIHRSMTKHAFYHFNGKLKQFP